MTPVILLAFANDKQNTGAGYLRGLTAERNAIRDALSKAEENGLCQVLVEPDATIDRIFDLFQNSTYRDRIAIFHYGGHADSYSLLLESASGATAAAHSEGLVNFLAKQKSLKLVFLNGCSSQKQSEELISSGLPAVIGTSQSINDIVATGLASRFYKGMSAGMNVDRAWTDAVDQIKTENGSENSKALFVESILGSPGEDQFPWKLYTGEGGVISKAWNLPEAANQPLFGLELPNTYYRKLPAAPYVGLRSFKREEAAIFFGRGNDIRSLYTQIGREQPVILLSGKRGVGKSSLLAAGLAPRLESAFVVSCHDISGRNISDSLSAALDQLREENGLEKLPPKDKTNLQQKIAELQKLISSVSGYAKDVIQNELAQLIRLDGIERLSYYEQWISIEERTKKPLVIILDEISSDPTEWRTFVEILVSIFETKKAPLGKLVLSIDEAYHDSFCELLQLAHFPYADVFLQPLTWDGMNEAIAGNTLSPVTKEFYRLQIESTPSNNFLNTLCGDLSDGDHTLVAPYLQVILSDLWASAVVENAQAPSFTMRSYQQGILSGEIMDRFLNQQLASLKEWNKEPVQSGLALDLLYRHTSALGKAEILEAAKRKLIYSDREEIVNSLIRKCKELFLLTTAHSEGTILGHNLLALVVIRQYSISLSPGQQAARILSAKTGETAEPGKNSWLNEADLDAVEKGMQGMRSLSDHEKSLLEFSRIKKVQAQKDRQRNRIIRGVLVSVVAVFAALAGWQWHIASQRYQYARAGELAFTAREELKKDNTLALDVAYNAYSILEENSPSLTILALSDIFHAQDDMPLYKSNFPHTKKVFTAVFSPDGKQVLTASEDGYARLWDINGKELLSMPHEIEVKSAAFSPNGQQILTLTRTNVYLWEKDGRLTDKDSIPESMTSLDSFSTDGMKIIRSTVTTGAYYSMIRKLKQDDNIVISSPAENLLLTIQSGTCTLFNKEGSALKDSFSSGVINASFSRDGKQFLTLTPDSNSCHITVWNDLGDSLYNFRCKGTEVSAVFSADGKSILTASNDFTAKLWDFSQPFLHRFPKQSQAVNTIDYFREGNRYATASFDSTARIWDASGKLIDSLKHGGVVTSAHFSPDGKHIITASRDSTARIWSPKESQVIVLKHQGEVTSAIFSHKGDLILTSSLDSLTRLWDVTGQLVHSFHLKGDVLSSCFSPDDTHLLTISSDSTVTIWDIYGEELHAFKQRNKIYSASFSHDGLYFLTSCADSTVRKYSATGELLLTLHHNEKSKHAIFTPDDQNILTGGKLIKIWTADGKLLDSMMHTANVSTVAVALDGHHILTTCYDGRAYLWTMHGELVATYRKHTAKINDGVFTPDGSHILTASDDGYVYRWRTPWAIYSGLKTNPIYQLSEKEKEEFGIVR
ncbi:MAG: AAA family ATPase [Saprospiraceae bacterium]